MTVEGGLFTPGSTRHFSSALWIQTPPSGLPHPCAGLAALEPTKFRLSWFPFSPRTDLDNSRDPKDPLGEIPIASIQSPRAGRWKNRAPSEKKQKLPVSLRP